MTPRRDRGHWHAVLDYAVGVLGSCLNYRRVCAFLALTVATLAETGSAWGQHVRTETNVHGRLTYTDNSQFGSGGAAKADVVLEAIPTLDFHLSGRRIKLDGTVSLDAIFYTRRTLADQLVPSGSILLNALLVDDIVGIDASLSASQPHVNPFRAQSDGPSVDIVTATRYRVSPYLDHKFSPTSTFYARADNVYTHTSGADPGTIPLHGSLVQNDVVRLDMKPDPVGLTVEGLREDTRFQGENQSALTIDAVRVVGWYGLDPQQAIGLVAGAERTEFLLTDAKDPIYGVRIRLLPGKGRYITGSIERRFFGTGWTVALGQANPLFAVNLNLQRIPFTFPAAINLTPPNGNVVAALDSAFASRYPDPAARARAIQDVMTSRGLPTNLAAPFTIFSGNAQLNQDVDASIIFFGRRDTITLFVLKRRIETLLRKGSGQAYVPSFSTDNTQLSIGADFNHRLTPVTTLDVVINGTRLIGLGALSDSRSHTGLVRVSINTRLTPRTTATLGARHQVLRSTVAPRDNESAVFVGVTHRF